MQHTPEGPSSQDPGSRSQEPARDGSRDAGRARRSAAALAALAVFGASGTTGAHAVDQEQAPSPSTDPDGLEGSTRIVQPGDSLWSVATAHGLSVDDLMEWNELSGDAAVSPGDTLRLRDPEVEAGHDPGPGDEAARVVDPAHRPGPAPAASQHRTAPGDSLWSLSQRHGITVQQLVEANDLDIAAPLGVGRMLEIPAAPGPQDSPAHEAAPTTADDADAGAADAAPARAGADAEPSDDGAQGPEHDDGTRASAQRHLAQLHERPSPSAEQMQRMVRLTAQEMGVDPALALAHAEQESGFVHRSVSPADAVGTMQVLPSSGAWASELVGRDLDLLDPQDNVTAGVAIIRENQRAAPSLEVGIASYYQGAFGVEEYGMYDDTKSYVRGVKERIGGWEHAR
ncbi:LysM peptidoglycan-binding domain-containing protein [Kocuria palustris]|uniref:LysM peptidoglycan-binding domain-containing protein n=1 Tax=Kocuria palustris TaxID=71999 RepID=UPI00119DC7DE|nr:LysM peptidoglycan-binding domain-containing protein [Kocuria palustris]